MSLNESDRVFAQEFAKARHSSSPQYYNHMHNKMVRITENMTDEYYQEWLAYHNEFLKQYTTWFDS